MNISGKMKFLALLIGGMMIALLGLIFGASVNQTELNQAQQIRYESYQRAVELQVSSDDLTRLARTYVVTGEPKYEKLYWEVLEVRNGKKPRADGRTIALQKLMEDLGFTDAEFAKLKQAEKDSNSLVMTETVAMNAAKGLYDDGTGKFIKAGPPDLEMARRIMHDAKYHADKDLIAQSIRAFEKLLDARTDATVNTYVFRGNLYLGLIGLLLVVMGGIIVYTGISIRRVLSALVTQLEASCVHSNHSIQEMVESSQKLSAAATEQASAVEETVATLEELSSTVKQNADNSNHASKLSQEGRETAEAGEREIQALIAAMSEMAQSSKKIEEIIQVIDDIAFQTNLLALNAAVEAARAGDQGRGFAVVADAVRTLAQRTAVAAKDVTSLIKESVESSRRGSDMADKSGAVLKAVVASVTKVADLNNEIAVGSREQSNGIEQITKVMNQFDQSMQVNASAAEKVATGSEDISTEIGQISAIVSDLQSLVKSEGSHETSARPGRQASDWKVDSGKAA